MSTTKDEEVHVLGDHVAALVDKAYASRREDPGFDSYFRVE